MKYLIKNNNGDIIQEAKNIRDLAYKWNLLYGHWNDLIIIDTKTSKEIDKKIVANKFDDMIKKSTSSKIFKSSLRGNKTIYKNSTYY
jgi:DNA-binding sugar fermentation-stimulating protein